MCHQPNKNKHNGDGDMMIQGKLMEKPLLRSYYNLRKNSTKKTFHYARASELFSHMECFHGWCTCDHSQNLQLTPRTFWRFIHSSRNNNHLYSMSSIIVLDQCLDFWSYGMINIRLELNLLKFNGWDRKSVV